MRRETDLYQPVKEYFEAQGFVVRGEVNGCDLVAMRETEHIIVELKAAFNLELVLQAVDRQRLTESVFVAVEAPRTRANRSRWQAVELLCRRLGLGLLTVRFGQHSPVVTLLTDAAAQPPRRSAKRTERLLKEFRRRSGDRNAGGTTRRPLVTAYREEALRIAAVLEEAKGPLPTRAIRQATANTKASTILLKDYYGWFERVEKGVYRLTPSGTQALRTYADVVADQQGGRPV